MSSVRSPSFGTIGELVPAFRQQIHDAPRLNIRDAFGQHAHFRCAMSQMLRIIDVSKRPAIPWMLEKHGGPLNTEFPVQV